MLISKYDMERPHDEILKRALPYLIFPPKEFRDALAEHLDSLCQYYRDKNDEAYSSRYTCINIMLDQARFDEHTEFKIHNLDYNQRTVYESLKKIEERLVRLESGSKQKPKNNTTVIVKDTSIHQKTEDSVKKEDIKKIATGQIVSKCLISANKSMTLGEIAHSTGLTTTQVSNAMRQGGRIRNNIKAEKVSVEKSVPCKSGKPVTKVQRLNVYSWVGER